MRPTPVIEPADDRHAAAQTPAATSRNARPPLARIALPLGILTLAALVTTWLLLSKPRAPRRPPVHNAPLVEVIPAPRPADVPAVVEVMGTVRPAREVALHPRVRGEVVFLSPDLIPGGFVARGAPLLSIDPADYRLAQKQAQSDVVQAEANLAVERGNQALAQKEFEMLGQSVSDEERSLVLRVPQLNKASAVVDTTRAALERADLDLARTTIRAPFNAVLRARHVNVGASVTETTSLVTLIGTDHYWVTVSVPVDELKWIEIPSGQGVTGSPARIFDDAAWGQGSYRTGHVLSLAPDLEEEGRMATLIIEVDDPLALQPDDAALPKMLIGSYVRVELHGVTIEDGLVLDRQLLRDGNKLWVLSADNRLEIRPVDVLLLRPDKVFLKSELHADEPLVVTDIPTPVEGMPLRAHRSGSQQDESTLENDP